MQKMLEFWLAWLTKKILKRHKPFVVAVSGSVGKTSAKEAVFVALSEWKRSATSPKNYNNELGVPLSVIGGKAPGKNPIKWVKLFAKAKWLAFIGSKSYPECLVLEFGGDHVGDIEHLMQLAPPSVGVLTAIEATHTEFYGSVEAIEEEEGKVITMLPTNGTGVVNIDNPHAKASLAKTKARTIGYGFDHAAEVHAVSSVSSLDWDRYCGSTELSVRSGQDEGMLEIRDVIGSHSCYAPLAALGAAKAVGMPFTKALEALKDYHAPKGRMRIIPGIKGTIIIDDTYNSSPAAAKKALDALAQLHPKSESGKRIAVLGNMAELGSISMASHEEVGKHAAKLGLDILVTVGDKSMDTARAAKEAGEADTRYTIHEVVHFASSEEAGKFVQERMKPGDLVLCKGSQSARMEKVVKELMADPMKAEELLVRQDAEWL